MPTIDAHLRRKLHKYAIELRKLAYTLPNGVAEHDFLQLSEQMHTAADETPKKYLTANTSAQASGGR
jgi:hypothetical protein